VINKMLRDLDQRHAGQVGNAAAAMPSQRAASGTSPVKAAQRPIGAAHRPLAVAVLLLLAAGAAWWWYQPSIQRSAAPPSQAVVLQVVASAPMSAPPAAPVPVPNAASNASTSVVLDAREPLTLAVRKPVVALAPAPKLLLRQQAPVAATTPGAATEARLLESSLMRLPASPRVAPQPAMAAPAAVVPQAAVVLQAAAARPAALEALAQAQGLWSAGSHAAATELLSQALAHVEGSTPSGVPVASQSPLASLARELARMFLADGQVSQALALLKRLEPQLAQVADVWAMRGNAAQRLGQHAEAAQSYQKALAMRPDEPRWMLGAAVSLAAQGQTAAAGDLADKARVMGALRPEVASYLRQLGVIIRTD
jgi:hypothetical protein